MIHNEENPLGIKSIDHLEFCVSDLSTPTKDLFLTFGFEKIAQHQSLPMELFGQGQIRFVINADHNSRAFDYFQRHGEGVSKIAFLVEDAEYAYQTALLRGAESVSPAERKTTPAGEYVSASIKGFGDVINEFVQRPSDLFHPDFKTIERDPNNRPLKQRFSRIDHLTNNVPYGEMKKWVAFYKQIFGMKVTRYFDIKGVKTGLESEVVQLPNNSVIIPINEPDRADSKSQIQEFLDRHHGPGVQHIALMTGNIYDSVSELRERGIKFLSIPDSYYDQVPKRLPQVAEKENIPALKNCQLLVDGDQDGYLIQNFTDTYVGPLFFETIQRKNHWGFGEGNFQALFDAIELDQMKRGYLKND